jgi:hypothetical protein
MARLAGERADARHGPKFIPGVARRCSARARSAGAAARPHAAGRQGAVDRMHPLLQSRARVNDPPRASPRQFVAQLSRGCERNQE